MTWGAPLALGQSPDSTASADSVPVAVSFAGAGWIIGQVSRSVDPFYHGSGLLHGVMTVKIGDNVQVPLRVISEVWNYSQGYGQVLTTLRPAVRVSLPGAGPVDSLTVLAGDLWRVRHGQGLMLDYFESQGAAVGVYGGRLALEGRFIGAGWSGHDDVYAFGFAYDSRMALRYFDNNSDGGSYQGSRIVSADLRLPVAQGVEVYAEGASNTTTKHGAWLAGVRWEATKVRNRIAATAEYRHYDQRFFNNEQPIPVPYPYFFSLTALDKPVHNYHFYLRRPGAHDVVAVRTRGRAYGGPWFVDADLEAIAGEPAGYYFAGEASVGVEANPLVDLRVGALNKFFGPTFPSDGPMFVVDENPWWFVKAAFRF
jgi:hypothetical protein